jgi:hypothetical protein
MNSPDPREITKAKMIISLSRLLIFFMGKDFNEINILPNGSGYGLAPGGASLSVNYC